MQKKDRSITRPVYYQKGALACRLILCLTSNGRSLNEPSWTHGGREGGREEEGGRERVSGVEGGGGEGGREQEREVEEEGPGGAGGPQDGWGMKWGRGGAGRSRLGPEIDGREGGERR